MSLAIKSFLTFSSLVASSLTFAETPKIKGYFPTKTDTLLLSGDLLGSADYPRSRAPLHSESGGPDLSTTGIWKYDDPTENFYEKHSKFFKPIDSALGFFSPRESITIESEDSSILNLALDPGLPFTRQFNPDLAHLKAGPLHFDLLTVSSKALYSDYQSDARELHHEDGLLSIIELTGRAYARLTDDLHLSFAGTLYYLPGDDKWGVDLGGRGRSYARLNWTRKIGDWDIHLYDEFKVLHRSNDLLDPMEVDEIEFAGRYRLGRVDNSRVNGYFDSSGLIYSNVIAMQAMRPIGSHWSFWSKLDHTDFWQTSRFDDHYTRDRAQFMLSHEGNNLSFPPFVTYDIRTRDKFDSFQNQAWLGTKGRFTENLRGTTRLGYYWDHGSPKERYRDSFLYEAGLTHEINSSTRHSLYTGLIYDDDIYGDDGLYNYTRYTLSHSFNTRLTGRMFFGLQNRQDDKDFDRWNTGVRVTANATDYINLTLLARYESASHSSVPHWDRWVYRTGLRYRIMSRLHLELNYQYEELNRRNRGFSEHFFYAGITKSF
jgi:hypothetical protein